MDIDFSSYYLVEGLYTFVNIKNFPHKFLCIDDGEVLITPAIGDPFYWRATHGKKIEILSCRCEVVSGSFMAFFHNERLSSNNVETYFGLIDEYANSFSDELGNNFIIH